MPKITINGKLPSCFGVTKHDIKEAAILFALCSRKRIGNPVWHEVVVHLVNDDLSDQTHQMIMGIKGATDVVTQAYTSIPPEEEGLYGELFVNTDQAIRIAPKRKGWSITKELLLYIAHGMDHLSGADDHSDSEYRAMRRRELSWIRKFYSELFSN